MQQFHPHSQPQELRLVIPVDLVVHQVDSSDGIHDMTFFEAILSKDAVFYLATDSLVAPLIEAIECDEIFGGR